MKKNPIKMTRNPNSPAAIQARANNQPDPTPFDKINYITDSEAGRIFIDLTKSDVEQRIGYIVTGGPYTHNRQFIKSTTNRDPKSGKLIMTNYFTDFVTRQWIIIRGFVDGHLPSEFPTTGSPKFPIPRPTYGNFFGAGLYASAPGETWRNFGRSVEKLKQANKQLHAGPTIDPDSDNEIDHPRDRYSDGWSSL